MENKVKLKQPFKIRASKTLMVEQHEEKPNFFGAYLTKYNKARFHVEEIKNY